MHDHAVAVDIGGTKITAALVRLDSDNEGNHVASQNPLIRIVADRDEWTQKTPHSGSQAVCNAVVNIVNSVLQFARQNNMSIRGIGIGSAGVVDADGRKIVSATDAIPGWAGTALADTVEQATSIETIVENDVHAHARGEMTSGAGSQADSALMVAIGTGIGGAMVVGGEILRGAHGLGGHVGHILVPGAENEKCSCGGKGHLEAIASGPGMVQMFRSKGEDARNAVELEQQANEGNLKAKAVIEKAAAATGAIIAGLANSFDPEIVILGGGVARAGQIYWKPLKAAYQAQLMPTIAETPIVPAKLGTKAALLGAAALVQKRIQWSTGR